MQTTKILRLSRVLSSFIVAFGGVPTNVDQDSTTPDEEFTMLPHRSDIAIYLWPWIFLTKMLLFLFIVWKC